MGTPTIKKRYSSALKFLSSLIFFFFPSLNYAELASTSFCEVQPATNPWQDIGLRWEHNANNGTSPDATIGRTDIIASAQPVSTVNLSAQINNWDLNINADQIPTGFSADTYLEYQFTTANFSNLAELTGAGFTLFDKAQSWHDQATGAYKVSIQVDDDADFGSPVTWFSEIVFDGVSTSSASANTGVSNGVNYVQTFAHFDPNGSIVQLQPNTTYKMRVFPYDVTEFGDDNGQPFNNIVLWDDFTPKIVSCELPGLDYSDAVADGTAAPNGSGATAYGEAIHTIDSNITLGYAVTAETGAYSSPNAEGDADDGVILPVLTQNLIAIIPVQVTKTNNGTAYLQAWIDWNGDGSFAENEQVATDLQLASGNNGTINIPVSVPSGATTAQTFARFRWSTNSGLDSTAPAGDGEVEDYALTIGGPGASVSGRIYIDADSSASKLGISGTVVVLREAAGVCRSVVTNGNGDYSFTGTVDGGFEIYQSHGESTPVPQSCGTASMNNPTGYQSTTPDILNINVSGADVTDQDFGEVAVTGFAFNPDHQSEILPGSTTSYTHVFSTVADGSVRFATVDSGNAATGWAHTLYHDSDCNGTLSGTEGGVAITGIDFSVAIGGRLCIIDKVFAASSVPAQDQYEVKITATFTYAGAPIALPALEATDFTRAGQTINPQAGGSRLELVKTVENLTQATAETETLNQAKPGDRLKYRIYYRNTGSGPILDLKVSDSVLAFTGFVSNSDVCDDTPSGMTCLPYFKIDQLKWDFTGSLFGGANGHVSYEVMIDN